MSTHNLCFGSKIRKIIYPFTPQFYYIKVGFKGVYFSWTCFPDIFLYYYHFISSQLDVVVMSLPVFLMVDVSLRTDVVTEPLNAQIVLMNSIAVCLLFHPRGTF